MFATRRHLRLLSWLALLAMLALALLPTLSHALASAPGSSAWAEVCTPQGTRLVAVAAADGTGSGTGISSDTGSDTSSGSPVQSHAAFQHCPFCAFNATALGPPSAPLVWALPLPVGDAAPALFLHAPRTLFAWRSAQPRGPPALA